MICRLQEKSFAIAFWTSRSQMGGAAYQIQHRLDCPADRRRIVVVENAAGATPAARVEMLNRSPRSPPVLRTIGMVPVSQTVHSLIQAAGLVSRRHEENIAAGFDQMGKRFIKPGHVRHPARKAPRQIIEEGGILCISAAQHDETKFHAPASVPATRRSTDRSPSVRLAASPHPDERLRCRQLLRDSGSQSTFSLLMSLPRKSCGPKCALKRGSCRGSQFS